MKIEFLSKIYIGAKKRFSVISMIIVVICVIMSGCMLLKALMGDFNISDLTSMLTSLIIIFVARNHRKAEYVYVDVLGEIAFENEEMKITYANVRDERNNDCFSDETIICYDEIELIEYGKELSCFRIVANCIHKRKYVDEEKEYIIENGEQPTETFIHVIDEEIAMEIKDKLQKVTKSIIRILEKE